MLNVLKLISHKANTHRGTLNNNAILARNKVLAQISITGACSSDQKQIQINIIAVSSIVPSKVKNLQNFLNFNWQSGSYYF